jgi:hypothetical protein
LRRFDTIREFIKPIVNESTIQANRGSNILIRSYNTWSFGSLALQRGYKAGILHFIEDLKLFPKIRYNKLIERLNRYKELLYRVLNFVFEKLSSEIKIVDAKPIETKELMRFNRHKKRGESSIKRRRVSRI